MRREVIIYSMILAVSLALAYAAATKNNNPNESNIPVVALSAEVLKAVHYKDAEHVVDAERIEDGDRYRLSYQVLKTDKSSPNKQEEFDPHDEHAHEHGQEHDDGEEPDATNAAKDAAIPEQNEPEAKPQVFAADQNLNSMLSGLDPLQASRVFESVSEEKLKEFGLAEGAAELVFERKNADPVKLWIGQKNFGSEARFVRVDGDKKNRVYVVDGDLIASMKKARARLFEKDLLSQPMQDYAQVQIKVGDKIRSLRPDKDAAGSLKEWLDEEGGNQSASVSYKNWLEKLEKVNITDYSDRAPTELGQPFMTTLFQTKDGKAEQIDFFSESQPALPGQQEKTSYYGFVHSTQSLVVIPAARFISVEKDVEKIFPKS